LIPESGRARVMAGWTGLKRVGSGMDFFQIFCPAPVLDLPVLTGHGSDGFDHGSDGSGLTRTDFFKTLYRGVVGSWKAWPGR
jgi:hypothetical protein